jgi:salicylate hydroxylase
MNVIIAGAGISGLAAAISLRRSGHRVTIYERSSGNNEVGAAINVPPNAGRFLIPWGLDPVKYGFVKSNGMYFISPTTLSVLDSHEFPPDKHEFGQPLYYAHRVDLHASLKQMATESSGIGVPVTICFKNGVVSYVSIRIHEIKATADSMKDSTTPSVTLQDGSIVDADLVIAADGIHSVAARLVSQETKAPQVASPTNCCYRFLISRADLAADPETNWFNEGDESLGTRIWPDPMGRRRIVEYSCRK